MLAPVRTVAPTVQPVTLDQVKAHCRVDGYDDDEVLTAFLDAATAHLDGYSGVLGRALVTQTWLQDFDCFDDAMRLPVGNLIAVSSVTYYDASNTSRTLASTVYAAFSDAAGPYLTLKPDQSWPSTYYREDAVRVTWTAGYGAAASDVPSAIRQAIMLMVGNWYENREVSVIGTIVTELPFSVKALLHPFSRVGF